MMFQADTAFATELIALVAGTALLLWAAKSEVCCKNFGKIVAYFTIVTSLLAMLCTFYYTVRYWEDGYFNKPHAMMSMKGMHPMQKSMMMDCPMMKQMVDEKSSDVTKDNTEDHDAHH